MRKLFALGCIALVSCYLPQSSHGQDKSTVDSMVKRLKAAAEKDREKVKSEIEKQLNGEYAAFLKTQQKPILELKARLDKLQAEFDAKMADYKEQEAQQKLLVQHRLNSIWLKAKGLKWPTEMETSIPAKKAAPGSNGSPVKKQLKPKNSKSQPAKTTQSSQKPIPTSRTFEVYLPGMV